MTIGEESSNLARMLGSLLRRAPADLHRAFGDLLVRHHTPRLSLHIHFDQQGPRV